MRQRDYNRLQARYEQHERRGAEAVARLERREQYARDFDAAVAAVPAHDVDIAHDRTYADHDLPDYGVFQPDE